MALESEPGAVPAEIRRQRVLMAAPFNVVLRGDDERLLDEAARDIFFSTRAREELLSRFLPDSEIAILNHLGASEPVRVEPTTFELLLRCREYWRRSEGAFDITVTPLLRLWDVGGAGRRPSDEEIEAALLAVGTDKLLLEEASSLAAFACEGVEIDLGGVGKGAALDDALTLLREKWAVREAYLSFGRSTVGVLGTRRVELMSPADERTVVLEVELRDEALSMSSVGPRRLVHGAYRTPEVDHIIDPRTGRARAGVLCVTAIGPRAEAADALTTALVVLGEGKAPEVAAAFGVRKVVFMRETSARVLDVAQGTWTDE